MEKDCQDIQQLDSEENDHQLSGDDEHGSHVQDPRIENPHWKGKSSFQALSSAPLLHVPPQSARPGLQHPPVGGHQLQGGAGLCCKAQEPVSYLDRSYRQGWLLEMGGWN
ncbi:asialoglycoprotein receptor 2, isoform CRA_b [Mus musculus]|nr:asialoglycoprotein receptor 2, isoform CRA_b [Mus musculus]